VFNGDAYSERRSIRRTGGLAGQTIVIEGLSATSTDVLVRIESLSGATQTERLSPTKTKFVVQTASGAWEVAATYLRLGIEHILFGFDHLLFVLVLVILIGDWRRVALTVTAFTLAHSLTLSLAAFDVIRLPGRLTESVIAASIIVAALNNVFPRVTEGRWRIAFAFGLLHGFGFASVLAEMGLPKGARLVSLIAFNLGVETGQLAVVLAVMPLAYLLRSTTFYRRGVMPWGSSAIAALALVWFMQRALG